MNVLESKGFVHHYYDKWEQDLVVGQVKGKCQDKMQATQAIASYANCIIYLQLVESMANDVIIRRWLTLLASCDGACSQLPEIVRASCDRF